MKRSWLTLPVKGTRFPRPRMLYTLPYSDRPAYGAWYFMAITNVKVVQRSWGLFELARRQSQGADQAYDHDETDVARLSYGSNFKYEEFVVLPSAIHAIIYSIIFAMIAASLVLFRPVSHFL